MLHNGLPLVLSIFSIAHVLLFAEASASHSTQSHQEMPAVRMKHHQKWMERLTVDKSAETVSTVLIEGERKWRLSTSFIDFINQQLNTSHYYGLISTSLAVKCFMSTTKAQLLFMRLGETQCNRQQVVGSGHAPDCTFRQDSKMISCKVERVKKGPSKKMSGVVCTWGASDEHKELFARSANSSICELLQYADTTARRLAVTKEYRKWETPMLVYKPPVFSQRLDAEYIDFCNESQFSSFSNELISTGKGSTIPLNPSGRTGLAGRGLLPCFGPNTIVIPILLRSKRGKIEVLVDLKVWNDGKGFEFPHVLEPIPDRYPLGRRLTKALKKAIRQNSSGLQANHVINLLRAALKKKESILYGGIVPDSINTDNAWLQVVAFVHMDEDGSNIGGFDFKAEERELGVGWRNLANATVDPNDMLLFSLLPRDVAKRLLRRDIPNGEPASLLRRVFNSARGLTELVVRGGETVLYEGVVGLFAGLSILAEFLGSLKDSIKAVQPQFTTPGPPATLG